MRDALYINGVFEVPVEEIVKAQLAEPTLACYLQPYAGDRIRLLAESAPSPTHPIALYISLTNSLPYVSYRGTIVGWHDKRELAKDPAALARLNEHIKKVQPSEKEIYLIAGSGHPCVNLIAVINLQRLATQIPVSCFIKTSDGMPLKKRTRAGGWSTVRQQVDWLGEMTEEVLDDVEAKFRADVRKALTDSADARKQRLASAPKRPQAIQVVSQAFRRNPDVVAEVLIRANGSCERCHSAAPFARASDSTPYLEVHHRVMLSAGGEDTVTNAVALCPNCHREKHYGQLNE